MQFKFPSFGYLFVVVMLACGQQASAAGGGLGAVADQSVLVHRITKSACLVLMGADAPIHSDVIASSAVELEQMLGHWNAKNTLNGYEMLTGLRFDADVMTRSALQIAAGDVHSVPVGLLLRYNPRVLAALGQFGTDTPVPSVLPEHRPAFRAVHRLRIRSQQLLGDLCLLETGLGGADAARRVMSDIAAVTDAIEDLKVGNAQQLIVKAPNTHIKITLGKVSSKWKTLAGILDAAAQGAHVDLRDVQLASVMGDAILKNLDEIVERFEALAQ